MNLKYFKYLFKSKLWISLLLLVLNICLFPLAFYFTNNFYHIYIIGDILTQEALILAFYYSFYFIKQESFDIFGFLPCDKYKLFKTRINFGLFQIISTSLIGLILGFIINDFSYIYIKPYLIHFALILPLVAALYFASCFACSYAKKIIDAIVLGIYFLLGGFLFRAKGFEIIIYIFSINKRSEFSAGFLISYVNSFTNENINQSSNYYPLNTTFWCTFILIILIGGLLYFITCLNLKKRKAEELEFNNDNSFGYRFFPLFAITGFLILAYEFCYVISSFSFFITLFLFFSGLFFFSNFLFQRSLKIKKRFVISYVVSVLLATAYEIIYKILVNASK